jgi:hypothetical protein
MATGLTDDVGRWRERKRLSAFASVLLIVGISIALWSAIISAAVQVP